MFQWSSPRKKGETKAAPNVPQLTWTKTQKVVLLSMSDAILYFSTTLLGFGALFVTYFILAGIHNVAEIGVGLASILIFLVAIGILGVTAQLPSLIQRDKWPWMR